MGVSKALSDAKITQKFDVVAGDCISIANAICDVFDGDLVAVSQTPHSESIAHVAVRVNGTLYDGRGKVSEEMLCDEFAHTSDTDSHIWYPSRDATQRHEGDVYDEVKRKLENAVEGMSYFEPPGGK